MLLTILAPDVRDHLCDREISTVLFLPTNIGSAAGEPPRTLAVSQDSKKTLSLQEVSSQVELLNISTKWFSSSNYGQISQKNQPQDIDIM
jgi:hypothetical protein